MANVKITDLTAYTNPVSTDVLPIVDIGTDVTKKVSIADLLKNASAGTAAAPGIAFDGDNTGIYSPGADQVAISTNGTGRLFVDSSGRVGIGETNPESLLHIKSSSGDAQIVLEHPGGANADKASITKVASDESLQLQASLGASNKSIVFLVGNNNEVARFDAGKELLIGTSTALSNVSISGGTTTPSVQIEGNSGSTSSLCITRTSNTGAANLMLQCGATATPVTADDKVGQINFSGFDGTNYRNTAQIASEVDGTPGTDDMPGRLIFSTTPSGSFSPTERMRIDSSGRLGLGTSSPSELLQVDGGNLLVRNNSGNNITLSTNVGNKNDSTFIFQKARGGSSGPTQIIADDNLGSIRWYGYDGSAYNEAAAIVSRARTNTGNFDADLIYDANGHNFKSNGSNSVFIDSNGNVGIGTISPSSLLHLADAGDITVGTTTGTKIGTATSQKIGFYNATPVVQPTAVADITTTATSGSLPTPDGSVTIADAATPTVTELLKYCVELEAKLEAALGHLRTLGLIAT